MKPGFTLRDERVYAATSRYEHGHLKKTASARKNASKKSHFRISEPAVRTEGEAVTHALRSRGLTARPAGGRDGGGAGTYPEVPAATRDSTFIMTSSVIPNSCRPTRRHAARRVENGVEHGAASLCFLIPHAQNGVSLQGLGVGAVGRDMGHA